MPEVISPFYNDVLHPIQRNFLKHQLAIYRILKCTFVFRCILLQSQTNVVYAQLEIGHKVPKIQRCQCDLEIKIQRFRGFQARTEMIACLQIPKTFRRLLMLPNQKKNKTQRQKVLGMGLKRIRILAKDPFSFLWNVSKTVTML